MKTLVVLTGVFLTCGSAVRASETYTRETEAWRQVRVAELTAPDGWLTLVGLHFLREGENRIGSAPDSDVVLPSGPALLGTATLSAANKVSLNLAPDVDARIDGAAVRQAELKSDADSGKPTLVTSGTIRFFIIDRGGKKAVRVKDSDAAPRRHFAGLDYFPIDPRWRIEARWEPFEKLRLMPFANKLGRTAPELVAGKAVFEREGKTFGLLAIDEGPDKPLFFVFSDPTNGQETYGSSRFVYAERPQHGKIVLDFNHAENPPCAFTPFAICPLPPAENRLPFAVGAGEKNYRGAHD